MYQYYFSEVTATDEEVGLPCANANRSSAPGTYSTFLNPLKKNQRP